MTPDELASLLNVSVDTVRKWRELGTGPVVTKLGRGKNSLVRYARPDVQAWLASHRHDSPAAGEVAPGTAPASAAAPPPVGAPGAGAADDDTAVA